MIPLADVINRFEADYLRQYTPSAEQRQALAAMKQCRTRMAPHFRACCEACGESRSVPHSCGHRSCPHCQHHESQQWLERQLRRLVPADYFLLTFTLPAELRPLARTYPRQVYALLFECAGSTLDTFCRNDKRLAGRAGAVAVLHTHSRQLDYHPHVHFAMPAAALDTTRKLWRTKKGYLFSEHALAKVFRARFLAALSREGLVVPPKAPTRWVVHCKGVGNGEKALVYLGRYLYRGVIQEQDILNCADGQVRFRYRDGRTGKTGTLTVSGVEFLRRVLQHVLPKGFRRARNFGFLHSNSKTLIALLQIVLRVMPTPNWMKPRPPFTCPCCGGAMRVVARRLPPSEAFRTRASDSAGDVTM